MASFALQASPLFPVGTTVSVYEGVSVPAKDPPPTSAVDAAVVDADGVAAFSGLDEGAKYYAAGLVLGEWKYVQFVARTDTVGEGDFRWGEGAPDDGLGEDGDFYYDKFNAKIHGPKEDGTWPAGVSIMGPAGPAGEGAGHTIHDEGTPVTQRTILDFLGDAVSVGDNAGATRTEVTVDAPTQAAFDAEATARADADTALDGRVDALEAVDYATQAELDAHTGDSSAAHAASASSFDPTGTDLSATDVQAAIEELLERGTALKARVLKSDSTSTQALTTSYVTVKQADNSTDSSAAVESGKTYEISGFLLVSRASGSTSRFINWEVRAGATVLAKSVPEDGDESGQLDLGAGPARGKIQGGAFTSDGTAVKLYVKTDNVTDTPAVERAYTYVRLTELETA